MKFLRKDNILFNRDSIVKVDDKIIVELKKLAENSENKRSRLCLHTSTNDLLHEMVIVFCKDSYIRPHKHNKSESFHIIEGRLRLFIFNDYGNVIKYFDMGEKVSNKYFLYRVIPGYWHAPLPLSDFVALHEVTNGPFIGKEDSIFPDWAPEETDIKSVREFLGRLKDLSG